MSEEKSTDKKSLPTLSLLLGLSVLIAVSGVVGYYLFIQPAQSAAGGALDRVESYLGMVFGKKGVVTRDGTSSVVRINDVGEVALMEFETKVAKNYKNTQVRLALLTSTKELRMEGEFRIKIGYDISQGLSLGYDESGKAFIEGLGEPKVLSAEMISVRTLEDSSGVWNKIEESDRDSLVNDLRLQAIRDIKEGGMLEQLDSLMRQNLKSLLGADDLISEPAPFVIP
jgi:hypothetical protein